MDFPNKCIGQMVIGEIVRCLTEELLIHSDQKCMCSVIRFCVLAENVKSILKQQEYGEKERIIHFVESTEYRP